MAEDPRRFDQIEKVVSDTKRDMDDATSTIASRLASHTHPESAVTNLVSDLASKVSSVTAGDSTITVGGTATAPTVRVGTISFINNSLTVNSSLNVSTNLTVSGYYDGPSGINFWGQSFPSVFRFFWNGSQPQFVRNDTNTVVKTFVIDHPTDPDRYLVHACTESPNNGVEYWGEATITAGAATVTLPAYFEALCAPDNRQVQVSVVLPDTDQSTPAGPDIDIDVPDPDRPGKTKKQKQHGHPAQPETTMIPQVAASAPKGGKFRIACTGPDGTQVAWLVKAVRKDVAPLLVEPRKTDVTVRGDGPYRYYTPNA